MSVGIGIACVSCQTYLVPVKNDILVLETDSRGEPYKIWCADLVWCPGCKMEMITGYGSKHISEHYLKSFNYYMSKVVFTIKGCPEGTSHCPTMKSLRAQWEKENLVESRQESALHASAPDGCKCSDCAIDQEPCPTCYAAWWAAKHPNTTLIEPVESGLDKKSEGFSSDYRPFWDK